MAANLCREVMSASALGAKLLTCRPSHRADKDSQRDIPCLFEFVITCHDVFLPESLCPLSGAVPWL